MVSERSRGQRAGLTRAAVVAEALDVVRTAGAGGLSMRSVAGRLGVAPNALYSHVADKLALVDAVLDAQLDRIPLPDPSGQPRREVVECMLRTLELLLDEPSFIPLYLARHGSSGPRATELGEALQTLLERTGVPADKTRAVVQSLVLQTIGIAAQAASDDGPITGDEFRHILADSATWIIDGASRSAIPGSPTP